jgi:hypothetical protein
MEIDLLGGGWWPNSTTVVPELAMILSDSSTVRRGGKKALNDELTVVGCEKLLALGESGTENVAGRPILPSSSQ